MAFILFIVYAFLDTVGHAYLYQLSLFLMCPVMLARAIYSLPLLLFLYVNPFVTLSLATENDL